MPYTKRFVASFLIQFTLLNDQASPFSLKKTKGTNKTASLYSNSSSWKRTGLFCSKVKPKLCKCWPDTQTNRAVEYYHKKLTGRLFSTKYILFVSIKNYVYQNDPAQTAIFIAHILFSTAGDTISPEYLSISDGTQGKSPYCQTGYISGIVFSAVGSEASNAIDGLIYKQAHLLFSSMGAKKWQKPQVQSKSLCLLSDCNTFP